MEEHQLLLSAPEPRDSKDFRYDGDHLHLTIPVSPVRPQQIETRLTLAFRPIRTWEIGRAVALQYFNDDGTTSFVFGKLLEINIKTGACEVDVSPSQRALKCHTSNLWLVAEGRVPTEDTTPKPWWERIANWLHFD